MLEPLHPLVQSVWTYSPKSRASSPPRHSRAFSTFIVLNYASAAIAFFLLEIFHLDSSKETLLKAALLSVSLSENSYLSIFARLA